MTLLDSLYPLGTNDTFEAQEMHVKPSKNNFEALNLGKCVLTLLYALYCGMFLIIHGESCGFACTEAQPPDRVIYSSPLRTPKNDDRCEASWSLFILGLKCNAMPNILIDSRKCYLPLIQLLNMP